MAAQTVNVLITGANRGLGLEMISQMVKGGVPVRKLIACCRDPDGPRAEVSLELLTIIHSVRSAPCDAGTGITRPQFTCKKKTMLVGAAETGEAAS